MSSIVCSKGCREAANIRKGSYTEIDPLVEPFAAIGKLRNLEENVKLDRTRNFVFNDIVLRKEKEGYLLFCKSAYTMGIVNDKLLNFIRELKSAEPFSFDRLCKMQGDNSEGELERIFNFLIQRSFIKTPNKEYTDDKR